MFDQLKKLFSQTAIYGLSSILGRVLNFLLVPLHTAVLSQSAYGVNTDIYVLIAFLIVIMTYGMETSFFRFSEKYPDKKDTVYSTAIISILISTAVYLGIYLLFQDSIIHVLKYEDTPRYVLYMMLILSIDVLAAIPFARLRAQNRAIRFVSVKMTLMGVSILANLVFFAPALINAHYPQQNIPYWFGENLGVEYVFIANVLASSVMLLMLLPEMFKVPLKFDASLWKAMMIFGLPLLISGLAGVANEFLDRQLLKYLLPEDSWRAQVGIYGAVYKLSMFLILFNQAFRYAAEPFFFSNNKQENAKETFAVVMRYFVIVMSVGFVFIIAYLDIFKYFIDEKFWEGLYIVPILLLANVFLGINTNLSFWYKLSDKTNYAILITGFGLVLTLTVNIWLIPRIGFEGAAWATLVSYIGMTVLSYLLGRKIYHIPYQTKHILAVVFVAFAFGWLAYHFSMNNFVPQTTFFIAFILILGWLEKDAIQKLKERLQSRRR